MYGDTHAFILKKGLFPRGLEKKGDMGSIFTSGWRREKIHVFLVHQKRKNEKKPFSFILHDHHFTSFC